MLDLDLVVGMAMADAEDMVISQYILQISQCIHISKSKTIQN